MTKFQVISVDNFGIHFMEIFDSADESFKLVKHWLKEFYNIDIKWKGGDTSIGFTYCDDPKMNDYASPFCKPTDYRNRYECGINMDALCDDLNRDDLKYGFGPGFKIYIVMLEL